jgi:aldehyde:ferredoxin oxidoreductase
MSKKVKAYAVRSEYEVDFTDSSDFRSFFEELADDVYYGDINSIEDTYYEVEFSDGSHVYRRH